MAALTTLWYSLRSRGNCSDRTARAFGQPSWHSRFGWEEGRPPHGS